ncbi:MAG: ACP phosphodiesterase [Desulfuromonas sp.]|nr:MAG: ACP phosphodiesterase [Desulfuromonas sp.]
MNYLVHLYLSDPDPEVRLGNLVGDFVKGRLEGRGFSVGFLRGLRQHRAVDSFSHTSQAVRNSKRRLRAQFRIYKPILVDIYYDHLLAAHWQEFHRQPLVEFAADTYRLFELYADILPVEFRLVAKRMASRDWLSSYADLSVVPLVLQRIGERVRGGEILRKGACDLEWQYPELLSDCRRFLKDARSWLDAEMGVGQEEL